MRLKIDSLQLSAIAFKYVFFLFWSCIDSSAPASVCHSFHGNSLSFGRSSEHGARNLSRPTTYQQYNAEFKLEAWVFLLAFKSILQSAQTFKLLQGSTTIPLTDALPTCSRLDPKLPEALLLQPHLPPNNCWVKWIIKALIKSRFII